MHVCILIIIVCYAYCVAIGICENLGVLATMRACREVLNVLKYIYLSLRKAKAQKVTVVEFAM